MRTALCMLAALGLGSSAIAGPVVRVKFDESVRATPVSGRLIVLMKSADSTLGPETQPLDGPFWEEGQPLFAIDVKDMKPGQIVEVGNGADAFPSAIDGLKPGTYEVQARLDAKRLDSEWKREPGNLYTKAKATLKINAPGENASVELNLDAVTGENKRPPTAGVEWFSVRSELLSKFRGTDVMLRAGVVLPKNYDATKTYAAVYEVPGFGGNDEGARGIARRRGRGGKDDDLAESAFWIVLDPEGPNGHTLFADSANNGPCGKALVEELIPALEKKFPLIAKPEARMLRGHSSGGWSTLWLATEYPTIFGACWSSSPDPVDFRAFQLVDIYEDRSMFALDNGLDGAFDTKQDAVRSRLAKVPQSLTRENVPSGSDLIVSYRRNDKPVMTIEREARGEDILGPDNTSGQQWDSWFAVFGPRNAAGNPAALFQINGFLDHKVAEQYRKYDIADRLRKDPDRFVPIFRDNIRLVVGSEDNFFLEQAVMLLKQDVEKLTPGGTKSAGFITIVPKLDHGSIFASAEIQAFESQMVEHLRKHGLVR
ncbi:MAG: hypothetical protein HEQ23_00265 [Tepidisphaera sp.]